MNPGSHLDFRRTAALTAQMPQATIAHIPGL